MMIKTLATGAALAIFVAGSASAAPQSSGSMASGSPKQPIPYSQLDAYSKASAKTRASKDWWSGSASTGMSTDTSATAPMTDTSASTSSSTSTDSSVNPSDSSMTPSTSSTMPSDSSTSMPSTPPTMPESTSPAPGSNLPGSTSTPGAPTEPK